ncbi:MAG TPA: hypothetical protein VGS19_11985 [Streptosporangiaceae bacterium]|nr:hypothetical protein [Streptosporangiaceae bacterium]
MVPGSFTGYFTAAAAGAGVLIGLLFVAVSLRPESIVGHKAPPMAKAMSGSAFTALVNSFFVSLMALIPNSSLGAVAATLALISLSNTGRLHLGRGKNAVAPLLMLSLAAFATQLVAGIWLVFRPHEVSLVYTVAYLLIGSFGVALSRAWALMQGERTAAPAESPAAPVPEHATAS